MAIEGPNISALETVFHRVGGCNESMISRGDGSFHPLKVSDQKSCFSVPWYVPGVIPSPLPRERGAPDTCAWVCTLRHGRPRGRAGAVPRWRREGWLRLGPAAVPQTARSEVVELCPFKDGFVKDGRGGERKRVSVVPSDSRPRVLLVTLLLCSHTALRVCHEPCPSVGGERLGPRFMALGDTVLNK